jgi:hypothetical protein
MKLTNDSPFAEPEKAARRLMQHAQAFEPVQDGRIYIEKINGPFLFVDKGTPAEYSAGLALAIHHGRLCPHDRARRRGGWVRLPGPSAYAAARLRFALADKGHDTRSLKVYLGNRNIQRTVR